MKYLKLLVVTVIAISMLIVSGCNSLVIESAPIHEVNISVAESYPPQVFIYIKGGLSYSCTSFHELTTERSGNIITINVTTERTRDKACAQVYGFFEKNINLGSNFILGETYGFIVNNEGYAFKMP